MKITVDVDCTPEEARTFLGLSQRWRFGDRVGLGMIGFFVLLGLAVVALLLR